MRRVVLAWNLRRLAPVGLALGAVASIVAALVPIAGVVPHGICALATASLLATMVGAGTGSLSNFFLVRNVPPGALYVGAVVGMVASLALVLVPPAFFGDTAPGMIALGAFPVMCLGAGLGSVTGHPLASLPATLGLVGAVTLLVGDETTTLLAVSGLLCAAGLILLWIGLLQRGVDRPPIGRKALTATVFVAIFGAVLFLVESAALTPNEAADSYVARGDYHARQALLIRFTRAQAMPALRQTQPVTEAGTKRLHEALAYGADEATFDRVGAGWIEKAASGERLDRLDELVMRWTAPARWSPEVRAALFRWAQRKAERIRGGRDPYRISALIQLTGLLDLDRAVAIWNPAITISLRTRPDWTLGLYGGEGPSYKTRRVPPSIPPSASQIYAGRMPKDLVTLALRNLTRTKDESPAQKYARESAWWVLAHTPGQPSIEAALEHTSSLKSLPATVLLAMRGPVWRAAVERLASSSETAEYVLDWGVVHRDVSLLEDAHLQLESHASVRALEAARAPYPDPRASPGDGRRRRRGDLARTGGAYGRAAARARAGVRETLRAVVDDLDRPIGVTSRFYGHSLYGNRTLQAVYTLRSVTGLQHGADAQAWRHALGL